MTKGAIGIVVGGGPAPGINGVISGATLEAIRRGYQVFGIRDGFSRIMKGDLSEVVELRERDVARVFTEGGSMLGTSRANPTKSEATLAAVVEGLQARGITRLITIGGDDTATSAQKVAGKAGGSLCVAHVPKTIDNDLPLPEEQPTFGFQSACEAGAQIVDALAVDAETAKRYYLVIAMGRKAGHLALGMGFAAGSALTIVPEAIGEHAVSLDRLVGEIVGAIVKRAANGVHHGVCVLAEGLLEKLEESSVPELQTAERDPHGHIRYAEIDFGGLLRRAVQRRLSALGLTSVTVVEKNVGYELRCVRPNAFDRQYTRMLGWGVVDFLDSGGSEAMISIQRGEVRPIPFRDMVDSGSGKTGGKVKVRYVDTASLLYRVTQAYSSQLTKEDLEDQLFVARASKVVSLSPEEFRATFQSCGMK